MHAHDVPMPEAKIFTLALEVAGMSDYIAVDEDCPIRRSVSKWRVAWNAEGPFVVDSWETSYSSRRKAYRVVGKSGFQCATDGGTTIMCDAGYAQAVCDAANAGKLIRQEGPKR